MSLSVVASVCLVLGTCISVSAVCPSPCVCSVWKVNCAGKFLEDFPHSRFDTDITEVDFSHNNITNISTFTIRIWMVTPLRVLNVSNNVITTLSTRSFIGQRMLEVVDLSTNLLQYVYPKTFWFIPKLRWLSLSNNKGIDLPENGPVFSNKRLEVLHLKNCGLHTLSLSSFAGMPNLRELYLSRNIITTVSSSDSLPTTQPLSNLLLLDMSYNKLQEIPKFVTNLPSLQELRLNNNQLYNLSDIFLGNFKVNLTGNPWKYCDMCSGGEDNEICAQIGSCGKAAENIVQLSLITNVSSSSRERTFSEESFDTQQSTSVTVLILLALASFLIGSVLSALSAMFVLGRRHQRQRLLESSRDGRSVDFCLVSSLVTSGDVKTDANKEPLMNQQSPEIVEIR